MQYSLTKITVNLFSDDVQLLKARARKLRQPYQVVLRDLLHRAVLEQAKRRTEVR